MTCWKDVTSPSRSRYEWLKGCSFSTPDMLPLLFPENPSSIIDEYRFDSTISRPGGSVSLMGLSLDGRFLVIDDRRVDGLEVFDLHLTGVRPVIKAPVPPQPTSLTFENSMSFLVGFGDGRFSKYLIDLESMSLVHQWTNNTCHGAAAAAAIALDTTSCILALAIRSDIRLFSRPTVKGRSSHCAFVP